MRRLWAAAFPGEPCDALHSARWKDMGWQVLFSNPKSQSPKPWMRWLVLPEKPEPHVLGMGWQVLPQNRKSQSPKPWTWSGMSCL